MYRIVNEDDSFFKRPDIKPCKTLKDVGKRLHQITKGCDHDTVAAIRTKLRYYKNMSDMEDVIEKQIKPLLKKYRLTITKE